VTRIHTSVIIHSHKNKLLRKYLQLCTNI